MMQIRSLAFDKGGFRRVYFVKYKGHQCVGKVPIDRSDPAREWEEIVDTVKQYALSSHIIKAFKEEASTLGLLANVEVSMMKTYVLELEDGRRVMMEGYQEAR